MQKHLFLAILSLIAFSCKNDPRTANTPQETQEERPFDLNNIGALAINPNYFPGADSVVCIALHNQDDLERYISIPMLEDGTPTLKVDWNKEYVVVLVHPYVNNRTTVRVGRSYASGNVGVVDVEVISGDQLNYSIRPASAYTAPRDPQIKFLDFRRMNQTLTKLSLQ
ncbi:MAG: hypothetical protein ACK4NS_05195 [Saprospiraceae bacterium]